MKELPMPKCRQKVAGPSAESLETKVKTPSFAFYYHRALNKQGQRLSTPPRKQVY